MRPRAAHHRLLRVRVGNATTVVRNPGVPNDGEEGRVEGAEEVVEREDVGVEERFRSVFLRKYGTVSFFDYNDDARRRDKIYIVEGRQVETSGRSRRKNAPHYTSSIPK